MKFEFDYKCDIPWEEMQGGDRRRFCGNCRKHVHHISSMTKDEALKFLDRHNWEVCVDFYCDSDGEVVFKERERRAFLQADGLKQLLASAVAVVPLVLAAAFMDTDALDEPAVVVHEQPIDLGSAEAAIQPSVPDFSFVSPTMPPPRPEVPVLVEPDVVVTATPKPEPEPVDDVLVIPKPRLRGRIAMPRGHGKPAD